MRRSGDVVLHAENLTKAYDTPLFTDLSFSLPRGRRLGIMGPNGSGKTTLLRVLLDEEAADSGKVQRGHLTEFGYYDQHLLSVIDLVGYYIAVIGFGLRRLCKCTSYVKLTELN